MSIRHEGGCLCGAVRYAFTGKPLRSAWCHCLSCRMAAGAPAIAFVALAPAQFSWSRGELAFYASSPGVRRGFCAACGTAMTYERDDRADIFDVLSATLDDPAPFPPTREYFTEERNPWMHISLAGTGDGS